MIERFEISQTSREDAVRSEVHCSTTDDKMEAKMSAEHLDHVTMLAMRVHILQKAMLDILRLLEGYGSVELEIGVGGGEWWMCFQNIMSQCFDNSKGGHLSFGEHTLLK